ncbi:MAG: TetR/AcrR family transcriptional regulator [Spirochaetales bacterium]|nr:TetR/AcrR family transcriptional regulator [Spirochaetales bacterium]
MSRPWKRANDEEQKNVRRLEIKSAARELNQTVPFSRMTLADIARSASFTRSNLYKYYSCREDLFLELMGEDFVDLVEDLEKSLTGRPLNIKELSHIWVDLILQHMSLIELYSLSVPVLEKGAGEEALSRWYEILKEGMVRLNSLILNLFPHADRYDIDEFLHVQTAQIIGLTPMLKLDERQQAIRKRATMNYSRNYFREILCHAVESLLGPWV